jgi:hypothetical protein
LRGNGAVIGAHLQQHQGPLPFACGVGDGLVVQVIVHVQAAILQPALKNRLVYKVSTRSLIPFSWAATMDR